MLIFRATTAAFRCEMPRLAGLPHEQRLAAYARLTADHAAVALRRPGDLPELEERLYANAYRLGRLLGRPLRVRTLDDVMLVARFLYGVLDIDLTGCPAAGSAGGEITIRRCYFSSFYSPEICRLMSAMDRGLFAGLAGGGELTFSERITEGQACCRARFEGPTTNRTTNTRITARF